MDIFKGIKLITTSLQDTYRRGDFGILEHRLLLPVLAALLLIGLLLLVGSKQSARRQKLLLGFRPPLQINKLSKKNTVLKPRLQRSGGISAIAIALLIGISLLRPYWGSKLVVSSKISNRLVIAVDISLSMAAQDLVPSRIEVAKRYVRDLLRYYNSDSGSVSSHESNQVPFSVEISLVAFSTNAYEISPFTSDYKAAELFLDSFDAELLSTRGSSIESGLTGSLAVLQSAKEKTGQNIIVLITDGDDRSFSSKTSAIVSQLKEQQIQVFSLGMGDTQGFAFQGSQGAAILDQDNHPVVSKLNEAELEFLSKTTGGSYLRANQLPDAPIELAQLIANSSVSTQIKDLKEKLKNSGSASVTASNKTRQFKEIGADLNLIALVILLLNLIWRSQRLLGSVLVIFFATNPAYSQDNALQPGSLYEGKNAYKVGNYEAAKEIFEEFHRQYPKDKAITQALASTYFKLNQTAEAESLFSQLTEEDNHSLNQSYFSDTAQNRYRDHYNRGTNLIALKRFQDAINQFDQALISKPGDEAAKHNRAVAEQLLQAQDKQKTESPAKTDPKKKESEKPEPNPEGSAPNQQQQDQQGENQQESQGKGQEDQGNHSNASSQQQPLSDSDNQSPESEGVQKDAVKSKRTSTKDQDTAADQSLEEQQQSGSPKLEDRLQNDPEAKGSDQEANPTDSEGQFDPSSNSKENLRAILEALPETPLLSRGRIEERSRRDGPVQW